MSKENDKPVFSQELYRWLWNWCLDYLARFEVSTQKLTRKMHMRKEKYPDDVSSHIYQKAMDAVILRLVEQHLLSDERYGAGRLRQLLRRGKSLSFIRQDLNYNGLSPYLIDDLIDALTQEEVSVDEMSALRFMKKKSIGPFCKPDILSTEIEDIKADRKARQKILASMARQGFDYMLAQKMLALEIDEAEDMLSYDMLH